MQGFDWNDLRFLLALQRAGTLAGAGRALGVDETTVSRRLRRLEARLGVALFHRSGAGRHEPSDVGLEVIARAERIEAESRNIDDLIGRAGAELQGVVRVTSTPLIVNRLLVPNLPGLQKLAPALVIELIPQSRNLSLSRRETDIAVRLARPQTGGHAARARRVGSLRFDAYESVRAEDQAPGACEWISYADGFGHLPQAQWISRRMQEAAEMASNLRVADAETALEAAARGGGRTLLPRAIADRDPRLRRCSAAGSEAALEREVWIVALADQKARRSVRVALEWLNGLDWAGSDDKIAWRG